MVRRAAPGETVRLKKIKHPAYGPQIGVLCRQISNFDNALRREIPGRHRNWDGDLSVWFISTEQESTLVALCNNYFDAIIWDPTILRGFVPAQTKPPTSAPPPPRPPPPPPPPPPRGRPRYQRSTIEDLFGEEFDKIFGFGRSAAPPPKTPGHDFFTRKHASIEDYRTLQIDPNACEEVRKAAYRALALKFHPDRGGSADKLAAVNVAWERINKGEK